MLVDYKKAQTINTENPSSNPNGSVIVGSSINRSSLKKKYLNRYMFFRRFYIIAAYEVTI